MTNETPVTLGLKKSFGFGDRLGLAGPGHIAALQKSDFAGILSQQSIREMTRTNRTPEQVMRAAQEAVAAADYSLPWGADADHLKTEADVQWTAEAGFCFFTIDPSEFVVNEADTMDETALKAGVAKLVNDSVFDDANWEEAYLKGAWDIGSRALKFDQESLYRAAVKYARAVEHCGVMAGFIAKHNPKKLYEIEVSVDETDAPTSHLEHLFFALELRRRGVTVVSLAPRFIGQFEKGVDYKGDIAAFEAALEDHVAIAKAMGPYKISIHSGSDKFSIYPSIGRICGDLLHVKTAGTSYLEALRVVCRQSPALFREIIAYSAGRFPEDKASYHISVTDDWVAGLGAIEADEVKYLDEDFGRQLLHVTFGSVLTRGKAADGRSFKEGILESLEGNADLHAELLEQHLGKHLSLLNAG
ncbi:tagaturonate epimerase family protein [Cerasicoccus frondis]|uniref:tagaturonate epimerase family protein n=1 Tax=Cerasicoccus frondis TaxID=490090 RepID=UPI002852D043|nr:tagaturonate epimerase family protein [Cerasicoccus frondis]